MEPQTVTFTVPTDEEIMGYTAADILKEDTILSLYDIDGLERTRKTALLQYRAREVGVEKEIIKILKAADKADKNLAEQYTWENKKKNPSVPITYDSRGKPQQTIDNIYTVLCNDTHFKGLKYNQLTNSPEQHRNGAIEVWGDTDDADARAYIETKYELYSPQKYVDAARKIMRDRGYHPVRQIVDALIWDGTPRIEELLIKWLKCDDSDYTREVSRLIFAGGIHRAYNPGCKFEDVPVLVGTKQGEGKSTFVRWLAIEDRFFAEVSEIEGQKGIEAIEGAWICEIAELLALTKTKEVEAVKSYISRQSDRYRRPWNLRVGSYKRQCIFVGTTNKEQFLTDKTGNRRWYPLKVYQSGYDLYDNEKEIRADILQCWAEAKAKINTPEMQPFANRKLFDDIKAHQQGAAEDDYREGMIADYLTSRDSVCVVELWREALNNPPYSVPTRKDSCDISLILQSLGWSLSGCGRVSGYGVQKLFRPTQNNTQTTLEDDEIPF